MNKIKLYVEVDILSNFLDDGNIGSYVGNIKELTSIGKTNHLSVIIKLEGNIHSQYNFNQDTEIFEKLEDSTSP